MSETSSTQGPASDGSSEDRLAAAWRVLIGSDDGDGDHNNDGGGGSGGGAVSCSAADRAAVCRTLERIAGAAGGDDRGADPISVVRVVAASTWLGRFLVRYPDALSELRNLPPVRSSDEWQSALNATLPAGGAADEAALMKALRVGRNRAMLGITARELATQDALATGADLAELAGACLQLALDHWQRWLKPRFGVPRLDTGAVCAPVVIAMGKAGGQELNYSSDIDIICAYTADSGRTDAAGGLGRSVDLHTYFSRLFAKVAHALNQPTEDGFVFRVDLDLRPEGRTGPICNSVDGLERYYETFGHPWERLAWIKARPMAGDLALGQQIIGRLAPFVFRRHLDFAFADEVAAMKARIDAHGQRAGGGAGHGGFDIKLGRGGIRELEFSVQTLQLMWGGKLPDLRNPTTVTAIHSLTSAGLVERDEAGRLIAAYRFLRTAEHAVQLREDRQTHRLPPEAVDRQRVAAALGFGAETDAVSRFEQVLSDHRKAVRGAFESVVTRQGDSDGSVAAADAEFAVAFAVAVDAGVDDGLRREALADLGFGALEITLRRLDAMMRNPSSPFHPRGLAASGGRGGGLGAGIIRAVLATPDPDGALSHFERLLRTLRGRRSALLQLAGDPRRLTVLANLFGSSHYLSRLLVRSPGLVEHLVFDGSASPVLTAAELRVALAGEPGVAGGWEALLGAVRRFHQAQVLRIGFFDLAGLLDTGSVGRQLSDVAEVIVGRVHQAAVRWGQERYQVDASGLGVVAMGKLAAREMGYGSDLDLIFVYGDGGGAEAVKGLTAADGAVMTRIVRRILTGLVCATPEGTLYETDTRLRPSGNQGALCVSEERLQQYHRAEAQTWERQAILRSRLLAGAGQAAPIGLGGSVARAVAAVRNMAFGSLADAPAVSAEAVDTMRERLAATASEDHLKYARGGLLTLEFLVQHLQLTQDPAECSADHPARSANVGTALSGLSEVGRLPADRALAGQEAYGYLRQLENRLALVQDKPAGGAFGLLRDEGEPVRGGWSDLQTRRLALRMGYGDGADATDVSVASLRTDLRRHRATIADLYETYLEGSIIHGRQG